MNIFVTSEDPGECARMLDNGLWPMANARLGYYATSESYHKRRLQQLGISGKLYCTNTDDV